MEKQTEFNTADTTVWRKSKIQRHNDHSFCFRFLDCCSASTPAHSRSSTAHQLGGVSTQFLQALDCSVCQCCTNASADLISSYLIPNVGVSDLLCVLLVSDVHNLPRTSVCSPRPAPRQSLLQISLNYSVKLCLFLGPKSTQPDKRYCMFPCNNPHQSFQQQRNQICFQVIDHSQHTHKPMTCN